MKLSVTWNIHLISSANKMETPIAASTRRAKQRGGILHRTANALRNQTHEAPYKVTLTRIGRQDLDDHDNLRHAFKNICDGVCDALGIRNDRDRKKVTFEYAQERGTPAIRVEVETK